MLMWRFPQDFDYQGELADDYEDDYEDADANAAAKPADLIDVHGKKAAPGQGDSSPYLDTSNLDSSGTEPREDYRNPDRKVHVVTPNAAQAEAADDDSSYGFLSQADEAERYYQDEEDSQWDSISNEDLPAGFYWHNGQE